MSKRGFIMVVIGIVMVSTIWISFYKHHMERKEILANTTLYAQHEYEHADVDEISVEIIDVCKAKHMGKVVVYNVYFDGRLRYSCSTNKEYIEQIARRMQE